LKFPLQVYAIRADTTITVILDGPTRPLTRSQLHALSLLTERGSLTSRELADLMGLTRSYAGSLLTRLERNELARGELIGGGEIRFTPSEVALDIAV
jgi:DNA-binding MarR family transcriptional regulator